MPSESAEEIAAIDAAMEEVNNLTGLDIYYSRGADVEHELLGLRFNRSVAVCDIGNGEHSVLLHNRKDDWFDGFDPYWYGEERRGNRLLKFPKGICTVNVRIRRRHLFSSSVDNRARRKGEEYHMGDNRWRFLTVIQPIAHSSQLA